jgi:hypothetical protein
MGAARGSSRHFTPSTDIMDMDPRYYNKDPFPVKNLVQTVPVDATDPRIGLRGGKKVVATDEIKANQIIGMYEGCYYFQCEHDKDRTILNEMEKQYKAIDVNLIDARGNMTESVRVKDKTFLKSGVRVGATLARDGYRSFQSNMLIDANNSVGPFSVSVPGLTGSGVRNVMIIVGIR